MAHRSLIGLTLILLAGCPDPPLLVTPLPQGYTFHSNGGEFGYISNRNGSRLAEYFGIRDDGRETWCTDFAWEQRLVICRLIEYAKNGFETSRTEFFVLDSSTGTVTILPDQARAQAFWAARSLTKFPELKRRYASTKVK